MIRIKIQYDKYDRMFRLMDKEFGALLEDGDVYELLVPFGDNEDKEEQMIIAITPLAHA
jgi:hypothetical protein